MLGGARFGAQAIYLLPDLVEKREATCTNENGIQLAMDVDAAWGMRRCLRRGQKRKDHGLDAMRWERIKISSLSRTEGARHGLQVKKEERQEGAVGCQDGKEAAGGRTAGVVPAFPGHGRERVVTWTAGRPG